MKNHSTISRGYKVVQHYIEGIYNSDIRSALQKLVTDTTSLYLVALQHRVMQLITDYEHALKNGVYENNNRPVIEHHLLPAEIEARTTCNGCDVCFWRNEVEIKNLADRKMLNHNHDSVGFLLRGFFEYYAQNGDMTTVRHRGFDWGREVLSLRTRGGILSKQVKGWVGAKTTIETNVVAPPTPSTIKPAASTDETTPQTPKPQPQRLEETKEIRHRYLFAIEDPFELTHNVARTVTHNGIVSIRDEFRRAWRILRNIDKPEQRDGGLLDPIDATGKGGSEVKGSFLELLEILHGPELKQVVV
ncbi:putative Poly(A) RNA polymerase protein cid1 [Glarea lozoyensis 74030]|uniref:Putative Poly(A) RNA polymerase protein cid1 n=1 Tax=Glarea lozoyensis (strain ATCC 74030 / MF5533) TaxID=1104152 RepID=H0EVH8_GLAL7|nr:putative Poly(A) RNA polymerase protein cid1 [Glarea lozoyensis 74030]